MKKRSKPISILFSILILFNGCTVYKSAGVSLDEASKVDNKVKVIQINGKKDKYSRIIILDDGEFYGKKKIRTKLKKEVYNYVLIKENNIKKVHLSDNKASTLISILVTVLIVGAIVGKMAHADKW